MKFDYTSESSEIRPVSSGHIYVNSEVDIETFFESVYESLSKNKNIEIDFDPIYINGIIKLLKELKQKSTFKIPIESLLEKDERIISITHEPTNEEIFVLGELNRKTGSFDPKSYRSKEKAYRRIHKFRKSGYPCLIYSKPYLIYFLEEKE